MAVVLLASFVLEGRGRVDPNYRHKRRKLETVAGSVLGTGQVAGIKAADPSDLQTAFRDKPKRRRTGAIVSSGDLTQAVSIAAADDNTYLAGLRDPITHRRKKI